MKINLKSDKRLPQPGDFVLITDKNSLFKNFTGYVLMPVDKSSFLVKILVEGNERNVLVSAKGMKIMQEDSFEPGGMIFSDSFIDSVKDWIGTGYSSKQIISVIEALEEYGDVSDAKDIKVYGYRTQEQEANKISEKVEDLFSSIPEGYWDKDLSNENVKDILWGIVMAAKDFYAKGGPIESYKIYHPTLSSALQEATRYANSQGYEITGDYFPDITIGGVGYEEYKKTTLELKRNGEIVKNKQLNIQIYRMPSGNYELTCGVYEKGGIMATGGGVSYMGNQGDMVVIQKRYEGEFTIYSLVKAKGPNDEIDMTFDTEKEARDYAEQKGLIITDKFYDKGGNVDEIGYSTENVTGEDLNRIINILDKNNVGYDFSSTDQILDFDKEDLQKDKDIVLGILENTSKDKYNQTMSVSSSGRVNKTISINGMPIVETETWGEYSNGNNYKKKYKTKWNYENLKKVLGTEEVNQEVFKNFTPDFKCQDCGYAVSLSEVKKLIKDPKNKLRKIPANIIEAKTNYNATVDKIVRLEDELEERLEDLREEFTKKKNLAKNNVEKAKQNYEKEKLNINFERLKSATETYNNTYKEYIKDQEVLKNEFKDTLSTLFSNLNEYETGFTTSEQFAYGGNVSDFKVGDEIEFFNSYEKVNKRGVVSDIIPGKGLAVSTGFAVSLVEPGQIIGKPIKEKPKSRFFDLFNKGGNIGEENREMVLNNINQIKHHTEEFKEAAKNADEIPAWVVAKVYRSSSDLSDVTHYLDGTTKMSKGGGVEDEFKSLKDLEFAITQYEKGNFYYDITKLKNIFNQLKSSDQEKARTKLFKIFEKKYADGGGVGDKKFESSMKQQQENINTNSRNKTAIIKVVNDVKKNKHRLSEDKIYAVSKGYIVKSNMSGGVRVYSSDGKYIETQPKNFWSYPNAYTDMHKHIATIDFKGIVHHIDKMEQGGNIGDTITLNKEMPYMASMSNLYGKEFKIKDINDVIFASGPQRYFIVEVDGQEYEVPERFTNLHKTEIEEIEVLTRKQIAELVDSFNNAVFKGVTGLDNGKKYFEITASKFAAEGIKKALPQEYELKNVSGDIYWIIQPSLIGKKRKMNEGGEVGNKDISSMSTANEVARLTGVRNIAITEWADRNNINLIEILKDLKSKKIKALDIMTAISGVANNKYAKQLNAKYSRLEQGGEVGQTCEIFNSNGERAIDEESIRKVTACVENLTQTKEMHSKNGEYTPERKQLHDKILAKYKRGVTCITEGKPIAVLMGGSPASGKSTFLTKYKPYLLSKNVFKVDADEIRAELPEYKGWNASQTHEETSDIVNTLISNRNIGVPCKFDFIFDGTMSSTKKYLNLINLLKAEGYEVYIVFIGGIQKEEIVDRALNRYKKMGRFVPLNVIDDFFANGEKNLNMLKDLVDGYMVVDASSSDYSIIEEGGKQLPNERIYEELGNQVILKNGGKIVNQYENMSPSQIWSSWNFNQKLHFLEDHIRLSSKDTTYYADFDYFDLPEAIQDVIHVHTNSGQYKTGGKIDKGYFYVNDYNGVIINEDKNDRTYIPQILDHLFKDKFNLYNKYDLTSLIPKIKKIIKENKESKDDDTISEVEQSEIVLEFIEKYSKKSAKDKAGDTYLYYKELVSKGTKAYKNATGGEAELIMQDLQYNRKMMNRAKNELKKKGLPIPKMKDGGQVYEFPNQIKGNDDITWVKTKQSKDLVNYTPYYRGYNIDIGGYNFRTLKEAQDLISNYILSNQWYNKLRYEPVKELPKMKDGGQVDNKILIAESKDNNYYFEPSTGKFYVNVIDNLGNRWNTLKANTIEDIDTSKWKFTKKGLELFPEIDIMKSGGVTPAKQKKIAKVMREFKEGELHIGQSDKIVKDPKQAIAIALSEAGLSKKENGGELKPNFEISKIKEIVEKNINLSNYKIQREDDNTLLLASKYKDISIEFRLNVIQDMIWFGGFSKIEISSVSLADPLLRYQNTSARRVVHKKINVRKGVSSYLDLEKLLKNFLTKVGELDKKETGGNVLNNEIQEIGKAITEEFGIEKTDGISKSEIENVLYKEKNKLLKFKGKFLKYSDKTIPQFNEIIEELKKNGWKIYDKYEKGGPISTLGLSGVKRYAIKNGYSVKTKKQGMVTYVYLTKNGKTTGPIDPTISTLSGLEKRLNQMKDGGKLTGWSHKKRVGGEVGFYGIDSDTEKRAGLSRGSFKTFKNGDAFKNELKKYFLKENINKLSEGKVIIEPSNWKRLTFKSAKGFNKDNVEKIFKPIIDRFEKVFSYKLELKEFTDKSFVLEF